VLCLLVLVGAKWRDAGTMRRPSPASDRHRPRMRHAWEAAKVPSFRWSEGLLGEPLVTAAARAESTSTRRAVLRCGGGYSILFRPPFPRVRHGRRRCSRLHHYGNHPIPAGRGAASRSARHPAGPRTVEQARKPGLV